MLCASLSGAFQSSAQPGLSTEAVVLRSLAGGAVPAKELWRHGRVSKRAMKTMLNAAAKGGLVEIDGDDARLAVDLQPVEPSACAPLATLVSKLELEHPHFPVPYGTADESFTGGPGVDWKPVPRESDAASVEGLPTTALLSQALVAFAMDYERERRGPIQWAVRLRIGDPGRTGMQRHGVVGSTGLPTPIGVAMRDTFEPLCAEVESRWRERFGSTLVDDVIDAVRVDGAWLPFPLVSWTGGEFRVVGNGS